MKAEGFAETTARRFAALGVRARRALWSAIGILLVLGALALPILAPPPYQGPGIVVGTDVVFRPSGSWADIRFASEQRFSRQVEVRPTELGIDSISFGVEKIPRGLPRASVTISEWTPSAGNASVAIRFLASSNPATTVWFNVSGLRVDVFYDVYAEGAKQTSQLSPGLVSFAWSTWPANPVAFEIASTAPQLDAVAPRGVTDLRIAGTGTDHAILEWTAPGDDSGNGTASVYDLRYNVRGTPGGIDFGSATQVPLGPPRPSGSVEQVNVTGLSPETLYWFSLRVGDEVPNWSPMSNIIEVLTGPAPSNSSAALRPPSVTAVWFEPVRGDLDVLFSKSMDRGSTAAAVIISPAIAFDVNWVNDAHLRVLIQTALEAGATYALSIEPGATDKLGGPMGVGFLFSFTALAMPEGSTGTGGVPLVLAIPLVAGLAGSGAAMGSAFHALGKTRRRLTKVQKLALLQARRLKDLRAELVRASKTRVQVAAGSPRRGR